MPDYMFLLESRLSAEQRAVLLRIQELAEAHSANVYLTGGAVRDLISGMPIRDLDFTVEGHPARLAREIEKGGARILSENERLREIELIFHGDVDGSISAARDEIFPRPGEKPEIRWSTIIADLRRRDLSVNAIGISLNAASRGLLLDPTNGLADLEQNHEIRALTMHSFTNRPARLLRVVRYAVRLGFQIESRTQEWFELAIERGLHEAIEGEDVGAEVRQVGREENVVAILKQWEARELIGAVHPALAKRHPDYDGLAKLVRAREAMVEKGYRPRLFAPVTYYLLNRLKPRLRTAALTRTELHKHEVQAVQHLEHEAQKVVKLLAGRKTAQPRDAYNLLAATPLDSLAFIQVRFPKPKALSKIRNFLQKWQPLRRNLFAPLTGSAAELEALGIPRGPKFDKILEDLFNLQLKGRGIAPPDRTRLLHKLAGIKPPPKKKVKEEKPAKKAKEKGKAAPAEQPEKKPAAPVAEARAKAPVKPAPTPHAEKPASRAKKPVARARERAGRHAQPKSRPAKKKKAPPKRKKR